MKSSKYFLALMSAALLCACTDKEEYLVNDEEQNTAQEVFEEVSFVANISDANTRVQYSEAGGNLKLTWGADDLIFVYPDKTKDADVHLATTYEMVAEENYGSETVVNSVSTKYPTVTKTVKQAADKAYVFKKGTGNTFVYLGYMVSYAVDTVLQKHEVDVVVTKDDEGTETCRTSTYAWHRVAEMSKLYYYGDYSESGTTTPPADGFTKVAFPSITTAEGKCQARWEHPLNSAGECQENNNDPTHLKYQEIMIAEMSEANLSRGTENKEVTTITSPTSVKFTHPKTVVFKIVMNQFLYSIHQGSHVGIVGVDDNEDEVKIGGVYLQRPEKYFAYNQTTEPETYLTVTPTEGDPCGYGTPSENLVSYVMVETSKLQPYKKFIFALTDNWSHDLYIWKLSLPNANAFESGQYYTVDLTSRTCLQALNMGGNVLWAVKNLGAQDIYDEGLYYRYGDVNGLTSEQAAAKCNEDNGAFYTKEGYDGKYSPVPGKTGIGSAIEAFNQASKDNQTQNSLTEEISGKTYYVFSIPEGTAFSNNENTPSDFLTNTGNSIYISYSNEKNNKFEVWTLNTNYDAASVKYGKQWHIPNAINFFNLQNYNTSEGYNESKDGLIIKNNTTNHKLFFKCVPIYKQGKTSTPKNQSKTFIRLSNLSLGLDNTYIGSGRPEKTSIVFSNSNYYVATVIRPVRFPLHTMTHVSSDVITGVVTTETE